MQQDFPQSGEVLQYDFRDADTKQRAWNRKELRVVQWNIERGYQLEKIIQQLRQLDADIICVQEIDVGCERTQKKDVGVEIASALKLNYLFLCEFHELHSPLRNAELQGGGVHGNGIFSKFDFVQYNTVRHTYHPYNWDRDGHKLREPRKGERCELAATVETQFGKIRCYSVHLEVFCGILGRVRQFSDVLQDARESIRNTPRQLILGDLNTMAHSIARFSPKYCVDQFRFLSLGQTEAMWWHERLMTVMDQHGKSNGKLKGLGLPVEVLQRARNPGFYDPFDIYHDVTLKHKDWWELMQGKLDWVLVRGFQVTNKEIGNHDFSASDHKWLMVQIVPVNPVEPTAEEHHFDVSEYVGRQMRTVYYAELVVVFSLVVLIAAIIHSSVKLLL